MRRRPILIAATWVAVVSALAASAHAQSPTPQGGQFVVVGVVMLEGGRSMAWVQEPNFTNNKVVTVRLGDSVGPYRVTKILTHQVELTGPGGTVSVPLAGVPGAVGVASSAGTDQRPGGDMSPPPALDKPNVIVLPQGDPRRDFPTSKMFVGAGAVITENQAWQPPAAQPRAASVQNVPVPAAMRAAAPGAQPNAIVLERGDPRRDFPTSKMFIGAR